MSKYNYEQMLKIMQIFVDCDDGKISTRTAASKTLEVAPTYPIHHLNQELSKVKKYRSGRGAYGYRYPAGWSKAFIEVTNKDPNVIKALKEQQNLYKEKDGAFNNKLQDILNGLCDDETEQPLPIRQEIPITPNNDTKKTLANASKATVWISWYFKRGILTLITVPLFIFLCYSIILSAYGAVIQGLALFYASYAVFGFIGAFLVFAFGWIPIILPPVLYYSLMKNLPGLWLRPDATLRVRIFSSFAILIIFFIAASLIYHGNVYGINWVVDHDPCVALSAGVTGARPPINCP